MPCGDDRIATAEPAVFLAEWDVQVERDWAGSGADGVHEAVACDIVAEMWCGRIRGVAWTGTVVFADKRVDVFGKTHGVIPQTL